MSRSAIAETTSGRTEGLVDDGVLCFKGVRYGAPTWGPRRFRPPVPPEPWTRPADATAFGPSCPPTLTPADRAYFPASPLWLAYAGIDESTEFSEDCLRLNVWTGGLADGERRPVLFWLHGGGFSWGSGSSPLNAGDGLARGHGVVVVTLNHRLGILGYLDLDAVAGDEWAGSGVAGVLDLRLALEWVRDNIEAFGGDPTNVTIVGHSGGGAKVSTLLAMPSARGLFHRAVIQSGVVSLRAIEPEEARVTATEVLARCGLAAGEARRLQELDTGALTKLGGSFRFRPVCDEVTMPAHPFDPVAAPTTTGIPLLIGTTKDDAATFKFDSDPEFASLDQDGLRRRVATHPAAGFGEGADDVIAFFSERNPEASCARLLVDVATATARERAVLLSERKLALSNSPVFTYEFTFDVPMPPETAFPGQLMSPHAVELPFVFDIARRTPLAGRRPERLDLARRMSSCWVAFMRHGAPSASGVPEWPRYDPQRRSQMTFDVAPHVENDPHGAERRHLRDLRSNPLALATGHP
ncbi:MAG: carboxylesterase family protein [Actinomycetota bacterium]